MSSEKNKNRKEDARKKEDKGEFPVSGKKWLHYILFLPGDKGFVLIEYSWLLAGEVTWLHIWKGVQYNNQNKNKSRETRDYYGLFHG